MSVLKGEGTVPILFGTTTIAAGTQNHNSYLARPDLAGEHPTIVIVPSAWGISSSVKGLCRRLARWGFAVIAMDPHRGVPPDRDASREEASRSSSRIPSRRVRADAVDVLEFVANPAGYWSSAADGVGFLGMGDGAATAVHLASVWHTSAALALVSGTLDDGVTGELGKVSTPILGLYGKGDDVVSADRRVSARQAVPHAEWVEYEDVGHDFLDDYSDEYDDGAADDAIERLVEFFQKNLPAR